MTAVTVNSQGVSVLSSNLAVAAIDTGTTLIGGPTEAMDAIWAAVPGSQLLSIFSVRPGFFSFRTFFSSLPFPWLVRCVIAKEDLYTKLG